MKSTETEGGERERPLRFLAHTIMTCTEVAHTIKRGSVETEAPQ